MKEWQKTLIGPSTPILKAMEIIDSSALQIALVIEPQGTLMGVVTDGDIRRGLLKGLPLDSPVHLIMNRRFSAANAGITREQTIKYMQDRSIRHLPIIDEKGCVIGLKTIEDLFRSTISESWIVLMAGGMGKRLGPLTQHRPKPLLEIGNRPILETIVTRLSEQGFRKFFISVNYKAEMIEAHFGNGDRWDADIQYLREREKLGTAGALSLLPEKPTQPFVVMNGDLLTNLNIMHLLDFHRDHQAKATMCVREYEFQVPYGVIRANEHRLLCIDEKPVHRFLVNAGIYSLEPQVLDLVPRNQMFDMPHLFEKLVAAGQNTMVFPICEYWMDIGRRNDLEQATAEYCKIFGETTPNT